MVRFMIILLSILVSAQLTNAQGHNITHAPGIEFQRIKEGSGIGPRFGDQVTIHLIVAPIPGKKEVINTYERERPATFRLGSSGVIFGLELLLYEIRSGDKVTAILPYLLAYGAEGNPPNIPPRSDIMLTVELVDVKRMDIRDHFVIEENDTVYGRKGLKWIDIIDLPGEEAYVGQDVTVHYTAYYSNGVPFESSRLTGKPIQFMVGDPSIIKGWNMALETMSPGDRTRIILPYKLAYGKRGKPPRVPPKANLIFDIELVSSE